MKAASGAHPAYHRVHCAHRAQHSRNRYIMALVSMRELLDHAATHGYGIPAFNVNNLEQVQAVMAAR